MSLSPALPLAPFFHDGEASFPHGAGPSEPGWYYYRAPEPDGPFPSREAAEAAQAEEG